MPFKNGTNYSIRIKEPEIQLAPARLDILALTETEYWIALSVLRHLNQQALCRKKNTSRLSSDYEVRR